MKNISQQEVFKTSVYLLKNRNKVGFIIPWILFPLLLTFGIIVGIIACSILGFIVVQFLSLKISLLKDCYEIEKFTWIFKKKKVYDYSQIKEVKLNVNPSIRYISTATFHFSNKQKETIELDKYRSLSIYRFLKDKGVKVSTNDLTYLKSLE